MPKRKKRLEKGIKSLKEVVQEHEIKRDDARAGGDEDLERYYNREIKAKSKTMEKKKKQLIRKK